MTTTLTKNGAGEPAAADVMEYTPFMGKDAIKLSVSIVQKMLCVATRSGKVCDATQAMKFMMMCRARLLNPFEGDAYLLGYDTQDGPQFSLITAHQAFLKRAETHPEYDGMESGVVVLDAAKKITQRQGDLTLDGETLVGGWATVYFKNRRHPMHKVLKLSTFNTGKSRWAKDPAGMIVKCAEADSLRSSFPTMLGGMYLEDEMPELAEVKPSYRHGARAHRSELNDTLVLPDPDAPYQHREPEVVDEPTTHEDAPGIDDEHADALLSLNERVDAAESVDALGVIENAWRSQKFPESVEVKGVLMIDERRKELSAKPGKGQGSLLK